MVRYADNILILCKHQKNAKKSLKLAEKLLNQLGLSLNLNKTHIRCADEAFGYLGESLGSTGTEPAAVVANALSVAASERVEESSDPGLILAPSHNDHDPEDVDIKAEG